MTMEGTQHSKDDDRRKSYWQYFKQATVGFVIVVVVALSSTGAQQFAQSSLEKPSFYAPYFLVWFSTAWMTLCYPIYLLFYVCSHRRTTDVRQCVRSDSSVFGSWWSLLSRCCIFTGLWIISNYSYSQALTHISAAETSVIFSANSGIVYVLAIIFLKEKFYIVKVLALLFSISGIFCVAYSEGLGSFTFIGVTLALAAAAAAAVYKVSFKRVIGTGNLGSVSLFMTSLGLCNLVLFWVGVAVLLGTSREYVAWQQAPWSFIIGSALLSLVFNLMVNFGIAITTPLLISVGMFINIPLNALIDFVWHGIGMSDLQVGGSVLILLSFLVLLLPNELITVRGRCVREEERHLSLGDNYHTITTDHYIGHQLCSPTDATA